MNDVSLVEQTLMRLFDAPGYQWLVILVALGAGAAHALAPGHGKSITAAYLVGAHGRVVHAVYLGLVVAAMHTFSAIVLALLWQGLRTVLPFEFDAMTGVLQIAAAVIVLAVGAALVRRRSHHHHDHEHTHVDSPAPVPAHVHGENGHAHHDGHSHDHVHSHDGRHHDHGHHGHSHTSPDADPFTRKGLVALGLSGGLVPSPTVFLILVSGLVTGRVAFAVLLVVLFGVGMMVTISSVGLLTLRGMDLVAQGSGRYSWMAGAAGALPRLAAVVVIVLGVTYLGLGIGAFVT